MSSALSADKQPHLLNLGIEDNGYLHRFFALLNSSKDAFETACVQVQIPETIVLNMGIIVAWFFTSKKDGCVRRKKRVNSTKEHVTAMLRSNLRKNMKTIGSSSATVPIATVTYNSTDGDGLKIQNVMYLMDGEVENFLRFTPVKNCLLQQWIHPCGNQNSVLHCLWTPCGVQISRRNARNLLDDRAPAAYRLATYESGAILPADISLCTSTTKQIIKNTCNHIVEHLSTTAVMPSSMTTYWKISSDHRVVLLWCSQFAKFGERKHWHVGPSVSPTIQLSAPQNESQASLQICKLCKNLAGIEGFGVTQHNYQTTAENTAILGDFGIKSISYGVVLDFCLKREAKLQEANSTMFKTSNHQWKVIPREFRSLQLGYNLKKFNSESSKPEFGKQSVSVCDKCYNKYTLFNSDKSVADVQSKSHGHGNPAFAILPPMFCSSYTVEAYERHFERLRGTDATHSKLKLAIKELSRVWNDDADDVQPENNFQESQSQFMELNGQKPQPPAFPLNPQLFRASNVHNDNFRSSQRDFEHNTLSFDSLYHEKHVIKEANAVSTNNSQPDDIVMKTLQARSTWRQRSGSSFQYNLSDSCPDLEIMFKDACASCKRTTSEQRLRGLSLSMAEWLSFCKHKNMCTLMPLKTSNFIAAFIHTNKLSLDPDENQMNFDEFVSAMIFLAAKANEVVLSEYHDIPDGKSCSGVVVAGVRRFLAGLRVREGPKKPLTKHLEFKIEYGDPKYFADVAELDAIFDISSYDEENSSTFELWQALPTISRMFQRVAASDSSVVSNMGDRSNSVSLQEWLKLCDDLGVIKNLPLKRSDCVNAFIDAIDCKKSSAAAHQEMNLAQFSQGLIQLAVYSGIWGDISGGKPSASSCSDQIVRGVALMLKELLSGNTSCSQASDLLTAQDNPLQLHASSNITKAFDSGGIVKQNTRPAKFVVMTAPMWQDIPMVIPLFNKVCRLNSSGFGSTSKRSKSVSMSEWMQMCDECSLVRLLPLTRADCISAFLHANKSIVSDDDIHELNNIEFCQSLIFLAAKSGILGNVDLSNLPSAGKCDDDVSRGVALLLKEGRMDQYVGTKIKNLDSVSPATSGQTSTNSNCVDYNNKQRGPAKAVVGFSGHDIAIADDNHEDSIDSFYSDNDYNHTNCDYGHENGSVDSMYDEKDPSQALHHNAIIDDDDGDTLSCDSSFQSSSTGSDVRDQAIEGSLLVETGPLWVMEPDVKALFHHLSSESSKLPIDKLLQYCDSFNFLQSLQLSSSQFTSAFKSSNLMIEAHQHSNTSSLSLAEFCQGLIAISCKANGSLRRFRTNFPSAHSCSKSVARSVTDLLKRSNMLTFKAKQSNSRDAAVPKLQIPPTISKWLSSDSAATHRLKVLPLFAYQHNKAPKQKTIVDLYAGASSSETSRVHLLRQAPVGSQSARSAPAPPLQAKTESHGARSARFLRKM
jgi:hypothetical protein